MGNENERKRDPAENRENRMGGGPDEAKTGGDEKNVGLTGTTGGAAGGPSVGSGGAIGGSSDFLSGESDERAESGSRGGPTGSNDPAIGAEAKQVLTGETGDEMFSGQPQSGTSFIAANNSRADLGASGAGSPESQPGSESDEPQIGPGGQSEIGGASDLGGGETGLGDHPGFIGSNSGGDGDYLPEDGNPDSGFAEQGRGAPEGSEPIGPEGTPERTANRDSDIEGSSKR